MRYKILLLSAVLAGCFIAALRAQSSGEVQFTLKYGDSKFNTISKYTDTAKEDIQNIVSARANCGYCVNNDFLFIFGGYGINNSNKQIGFLSDLACINLRTYTTNWLWKENNLSGVQKEVKSNHKKDNIENFAPKRQILAKLLPSGNNNIIVVGGFHKSDSPGAQVLLPSDEILSFNITNRKWELIARISQINLDYEQIPTYIGCKVLAAIFKNNKLKLLLLPLFREGAAQVTGDYALVDLDIASKTFTSIIEGKVGLDLKYSDCISHGNKVYVIAGPAIKLGKLGEERSIHEFSFENNSWQIDFDTDRSAIDPDDGNTRINLLNRDQVMLAFAHDRLLIYGGCTWDHLGNHGTVAEMWSYHLDSRLWKREFQPSKGLSDISLRKYPLLEPNYSQPWYMVGGIIIPYQDDFLVGLGHSNLVSNAGFSNNIYKVALNKTQDKSSVDQPTAISAMVDKAALNSGIKKSIATSDDFIDTLARHQKCEITGFLDNISISVLAKDLGNGKNISLLLYDFQGNMVTSAHNLTYNAGEVLKIPLSGIQLYDGLYTVILTNGQTSCSTRIILHSNN
jgi:hypothetical protein